MAHINSISRDTIRIWIKGKINIYDGTKCKTRTYSPRQCSKGWARKVFLQDGQRGNMERRPLYWLCGTRHTPSGPKRIKTCHLVRCNCFWMMSCMIMGCALVILTLRFKKASDEEQRKLLVDFYLANTHRVNNWDLVDISAYHILGEWLQKIRRTGPFSTSLLRAKAFGNSVLL